MRHPMLVPSTTLPSDSETWGLRLLLWGLARNRTEKQREKKLNFLGQQGGLWHKTGKIYKEDVASRTGTSSALLSIPIKVFEPKRGRRVCS